MKFDRRDSRLESGYGVTPQTGHSGQSERTTGALQQLRVARLGGKPGPIWQHWWRSQRGQCASERGALAGGQRWAWGAATADHTAGGHLGSPRGEDAFSVSQFKARSFLFFLCCQHFCGYYYYFFFTKSGVREERKKAEIQNDPGSNR